MGPGRSPVVRGIHLNAHNKRVQEFALCVVKLNLLARLTSNSVIPTDSKLNVYKAVELISNSSFAESEVQVKGKL